MSRCLVRLVNIHKLMQYWLREGYCAKIRLELLTCRWKLQTYKLACIAGVKTGRGLGEGRKGGDWGERFPFHAFLPPPPLFAPAMQGQFLHDFTTCICSVVLTLPVTPVQEKLIENYGQDTATALTEYRRPFDSGLYSLIVTCDILFPQLSDTLLLRPLLDNTDDCLTLTLSVGSLKGGGKKKLS